MKAGSGHTATGRTVLIAGGGCSIFGGILSLTHSGSEMPLPGRGAPWRET